MLIVQSTKRPPALFLSHKPGFEGGGGRYHPSPFWLSGAVCAGRVSVLPLFPPFPAQPCSFSSTASPAFFSSSSDVFSFFFCSWEVEIDPTLVFFVCLLSFVFPLELCALFSTRVKKQACVMIAG